MGFFSSLLETEFVDSRYNNTASLTDPAMVAGSLVKGFEVPGDESTLVFHYDRYLDRIIDGGAGNDYLIDSPVHDMTLLGGDGNDVIKAQGGKDFIDGGSNDDVIIGYSDGSSWHGGDGRDMLIANSGFNLQWDNRFTSGSITDTERDVEWQDIQNNGWFVQDYKIYANSSSGSTTYSYDAWLGINNGSYSANSVYGHDFRVNIQVGGDVFPANATEGNGVFYYAHSYLNGELSLGYSGGDDSHHPSSNLNAAVLTKEITQNQQLDNAPTVFLFGDDGDDLLVGSGNKDELYGGDDNDSLFANGGDDLLDGGDGDDLLVGGLGNDILIGGKGMDILIGDAIGVTGNDFLYGGDDNDSLDGNNGDDYLDGGTGEDKIRGGEGRDVLYGGYDNDQDILDGNDGDDILIVGNKDVLYGSGGNDTYIFDSSQSPTLPAQDSLPPINSPQSNNNAAFSALTSSGYSPSNAAIIDDHEGNNTLVLVGFKSLDELSVFGFGGGMGLALGNNQTILIKNNNTPLNIVFADSKDTAIFQAQSQTQSTSVISDATFLGAQPGALITSLNTASLQLAQYTHSVEVTAATANSYLAGSLVNDILTGNSGGTRFIGGRGDDTMVGNTGDDVYLIRIGDGVDTITDLGGNNTIKFGDGIAWEDVKLQRLDNDLFIDIAPGQQVFVENMFDVTTGDVNTNNAIQTIQFFDNTFWDLAKIQQEVDANATSIVKGTINDDLLVGNAYHNTIIGDKGNDKLYGLEGNDTYQYTLGDGNDVIYELSGNDTLELLGGINKADVQVKSLGNDVILTFNDGGTLTLKDQVINANANAVDPVITEVVQNLQTRWISQAEDLIEELYGLVGKNNLKIVFEEGEVGGELAHVGVEYNNGSPTANQILSIDLADLRAPAHEKNELYFDRVVAHEMVHAVMAENMNIGVMPAWFVEGAAEFIHGADERIKNDLANFPDQTNFNAWFKTTAGSPEDGTGYSVAYIAVKLLDHDIREFGGQGIKELFVELKKGVSLDTALARVSSRHTGLSTHWSNVASFESYFKNVGFNSIDTLLNLNDADTGSIGGSDYGNSIQDPYGVVSNEVSGGSRHFNVIIPEEYISTAYRDGTQIETIQFSDGSSQSVTSFLEERLRISGTTGNDYLSGTPNNDIFVGGLGNDTLYDPAGNDTYVYNLGDGNDFIQDYKGENTLQFGAGITADSFTAMRNYDAMILTFTSGETIRLSGLFDATTGAGNANSHWQIEFFDGSLLNVADIPKIIPLGTEVADTICGFESADVIDGGAGYDYIDGGAGDDILIGGLDGGDLRGGLGNDTYRYSLGDGLGSIADDQGNNIIQFTSGISDQQVRIRVSGADLVFVVGNSDAMVIKNAFNSSAGAIRPEYSGLLIQYADGTSWDIARVRQELLRGTPNNDTLYGTTAADTLNGGPGNDYLYGYAGNDAYQYDLGGGVDTIIDSAGADTLIFGEGISESDIKVRRSDGNLVLTVDGDSSQRIEVKNMFNSTSGAINSSLAIESVQFANGTVWDLARIKQEALNGSGEVSGFDSNDILLGNDYGSFLQGGYGDDTYYFESLKGRHTIADTGGNADRILLGPTITANDVYVSYNQAYNTLIINYDQGSISVNPSGSRPTIELIEFGDGTVWAYDKILAQNLIGNSWANTIYGYATNDTLVGNGGPDTLNGGAGDDTYLFNKGDGADAISETSGTDKIKFGAGIQSSDLMIVQRNNDTILLFTNGDQITIANSVNDANKRVELIEFANGEVWGESEINTRITETASRANTFIGTYNKYDLLAGNDDQDDYLNGLNGADELYGGTGNDVLVSAVESSVNILDGGAGSDTFIISAFSNTIVRNETIIRGFRDEGDRLVFNASIKPEDIVVTLKELSGYGTYLDQGGHSYYYTSDYIHEWYLSVSTSSSSDELIAIEGVFKNTSKTTHAMGTTLANPDTPVGTIQFADGSVWDYNTIISKMMTGNEDDNYLRGLTTDDVIDGKGGNDNLYGYAGNDTLWGRDGDDQLIAGDGDDYLIGGARNDLLSGGSGNDTYKFELGDGRDRIYDSEGTQIIEFSSDVDPLSVVVSRDENDLIIKYSDEDQVALANFFVQIDSEVLSAFASYSQIRFETGEVWDQDKLLSVYHFGNSPIEADVEAPFAPEAIISGSGDNISGTAEINAAIKVVNSDGVTLGAATANGIDGKYVVNLSNPIINGQQVFVTASDAAGNESAATSLIAPDLTAPSIPNALLDESGTMVTGVAEAGSLVQVLDTDGVVVGSAKASTDNGTFSIQWNTPFINGEFIFVTATDARGNTSMAQALVAPDITPPILMSADIDVTGKTVSGTAEKGSQIIVSSLLGVEIAQSIADSDTGAFSIDLNDALINGEEIFVKARDITGNESVATSLIAPDLTAPNAPEVTFDFGSGILSGLAEEGAEIVVNNAIDGTELGRTFADITTGIFRIPISQTLIQGGQLLTRAIDQHGNVSVPALTEVTSSEVEYIEGLQGSYFGYDPVVIGIVGLSRVAQVREIIAAKSPDATFVASNLKYQTTGTPHLGMGTNLQGFLGADASTLSVDPGNTSEAIVQLEGKVQLEAGTYNFRVRADDGYSIRVNGIVVAEYDGNQGATTRTHAAFSVSNPGLSDIDIIYWDAGGNYELGVELQNTAGGGYSYLGGSILSHLKNENLTPSLAANDTEMTGYFDSSVIQKVNFDSSYMQQCLIQAMAEFDSGVNSGAGVIIADSQINQSDVILASACV